MIEWHHPEKSYEIQQRYFSTGKGTYLWINSPTAGEHGDGQPQQVSWAFTFLDFGMCHTVAGCSTVEHQLMIPDGVTTFRSFDAYFVDGNVETVLDEEGAIHAVFDGHHARCVAGLYQGMGVSLEFSGLRVQPERPSKL